MKESPEDPEQLLLFDPGQPVRRPATEAEIMCMLEAKINRILWSKHRGKPPRICDFDWDNFKQEIIIGAARRCIGVFIHGGAKTLDAFAGGALYFSLRDIQRKSVRQNKKMEFAGVLDVPLLDWIDAVA